jgi:ATP phosphoribosyltransferase
LTLYAIRPDPGTDSLEDAEVVSESKYGWEFLEHAITLWRLVDDARAHEIETIKDRLLQTNPDQELRIDAHDLRELVRLLTGVEDAIVAARIVDQHWCVPAERLEELAKRVPAMNLKTERTLDDKTHALAEVMINAVSIRNFLANALEAGCVVVLG